MATNPPYGQVRCPEWFTKEDAVHQQGQQLMLQSKHGVKGNSPSCDKNTSVFKQCYNREPLYSSSFSELSVAHGVQIQRLNHQCGLLLSPKLAFFQDTNLSVLHGFVVFATQRLLVSKHYYSMLMGRSSPQSWCN